MSSKISLSLAAVLALSAAGVTRANPTASSTDEARAAVGAYHRALDGNESLAARPAVDTTPGRRN